MKKAFAYVFLIMSIILIAFGSNKLYGSSKDIEDFDIRGIKLGMQPEDVEKMGFTLHENRDYKERNMPFKFTAGAGTGWGTITNWTMKLEIAGEPYGNGVFSIQYETDADKDVDRAIFVSGLKKQLEGKYGNPVWEKINLKTKRKYLACWGKHCSEFKKINDLNDMMVTQRSLFYYGGGLSEGKYLLVSFDDFMFPQVEFYMFDTSPDGIVKTEEKKRAAEAARKKIQF